MFNMSNISCDILYPLGTQFYLITPFMFNMSNISPDILYPLWRQFYLIPFDARHQSSEQSLNGITCPNQFC